MGKKRALAHICEAFSPQEMLGICRDIGLVDSDIRLIDQRFYRDTSRELCDMPVGVQRRRVPIIETYIVSEIIRRKHELNAVQLRKVREALSDIDTNTA